MASLAHRITTMLLIALALPTFFTIDAILTGGLIEGAILNIIIATTTFLQYIFVSEFAFIVVFASLSTALMVAIVQVSKQTVASVSHVTEIRSGVVSPPFSTTQYLEPQSPHNHPGDIADSSDDDNSSTTTLVDGNAPVQPTNDSDPEVKSPLATKISHGMKASDEPHHSQVSSIIVSLC